MPPKDLKKISSSTGKPNATAIKVSKAKLPPKKSAAKRKVPAKMPTPLPSHEEEEPTPPNFPFLHSPSDKQDRILTPHYYEEEEEKDGEQEKEEEEEQEDEEEDDTASYEPTQKWDLHAVNNIFNHNGVFVVPDDYPESFPIMGRKGGAGFIHQCFLIICNDEKKEMDNHHFCCEGEG